jgi:hypothetical protein
MKLNCKNSSEFWDAVCSLVKLKDSVGIGLCGQVDNAELIYQYIYIYTPKKIYTHINADYSNVKYQGVDRPWEKKAWIHLLSCTNS